MLVKELIAVLSAQDPELPVLVDGYEWGYDKPVVKLAFAAKANNPRYGGDFNEPSEKDPGDPVLAIGRDFSLRDKETLIWMETKDAQAWVDDCRHDIEAAQRSLDFMKEEDAPSDEVELAGWRWRRDDYSYRIDERQRYIKAFLAAGLAK